MSQTYKIVRHYMRNNRKITVKRGLTLKQAQGHCSDPETSYATCTSSAGKRRTRERGAWFDGFYAER